MNNIQHFLPTGKLPLHLLSRFIENYTNKTSGVIVGSQIGIDAAVIDVGNKYLIAKTDPITFITEEIGHYAININANDIACMGGIPRWFLATILLPEEKTTAEMAETVFAQLSTACKELNIAFCGGHTEITYGINRPLVIGQMLGEVEKDQLIVATNIKIGDDILLTKGIAIEATSIIARHVEHELAETFSRELVQQCKDYIRNPGISVVKEANIAAQFSGIHAMHDPTEGGLATGLYELAQATEVGLKIDYDMVEIFPECKLLCDVYDLDPLGLIASGTLIIVCDPQISHPLMEALEKENIVVGKIGEIMAPDYGYKLIAYDDEEYQFPQFAHDEIVRFFNNLKKEM